MFARFIGDQTYDDRRFFIICVCEFPEPFRLEKVVYHLIGNHSRIRVIPSATQIDLRIRIDPCNCSCLAGKTEYNQKDTDGTYAG